MRSWNYVHADQVLPERLVKEIRQYTTGLLYIPTDITRSRQRIAIRVRALKEQGFRNCDIARMLQITPRHVCGILRRFQEATTRTTSPSIGHVDPPQRCRNDGGEMPPSPRA